MKGFYNVHVFARKGDRGRPLGGVTCLINPKLPSFEILLKEEDELVIKTRIATLVCLYYRPECSAINVVEGIQRALDVIKTNEKVILAGDLNCPVNKMNGKAKIVLDYLPREGLTLVNDGKVLAYICHNGGSDIDLTFVRGFSIVEQGILTSNEAALIRKYICVRVTLKATTPMSSPIKAQRIQRRLNLQLLQEIVGRIPRLLQAIKEGKLDEAVAG